MSVAPPPEPALGRALDLAAAPFPRHVPLGDVYLDLRDGGGVEADDDIPVRYSRRFGELRVAQPRRPASAVLAFSRPLGLGDLGRMITIGIIAVVAFYAFMAYKSRTGGRR